MILALARRLISLIGVLFGLLVITFLVTNVVPADPARLAAGVDAPPAQVEQYRRDMGLDKPIYVQFFRYISGVVRGDLGRSFATRRPVLEDLKLYFPATAELAIYGMLLYIIIAVPLGIAAALTHSSITDYAIRIFTILGLAIPHFVLALLLQLVFARWLGWFPLDGRLPISAGEVPPITGLITIDAALSGDWATLGSAAHHLVLPVVAIAAGRLAVATRFMRAGLLSVLNADYVRTARAKGAPQRTVVWRHAVRNAVLPLITILGLQFGFLLGGIVFIEVIFSWPGLGRYMVNAIFAFDFPAVIAGAMLLGAVYVILNAIVDFTYSYLDPRIEV